MKSFLMSAVLALSLVLAPSAGANTITFDLHDGSFVTFGPYTGIYQSPLFDLDVDVGAGALAQFWFEFQAPSTDPQFIELADSAGTPLPNEGIIVQVLGTGDADVLYALTLSDAFGSYDDPLNSFLPRDVSMEDVGAGSGQRSFAGGAILNEFSAGFPNDPAQDVTDGALRFFDLHLDFINIGQDPINLTGIRFWAVGTDVSVPEPATLLLLGTGLAAVGYRRRRMK